jgi:regulator of sirC expression with transglutaminase-like and TPR domain
MNETEVKALIQLLDDPDAEIYGAVSEKLATYGLCVVPQLERTWEYTLNEQLQERLECLIYRIQFGHVRRNLVEWAKSGAEDMLEGAFYVAQTQYPELDYNLILQEIEKIRREVWVELNNSLTALEKIKILNHCFFDVNRFNGNLTNFYSPYNSFINNVIESRRGTPISLSIVYAAVAQRLGMPVFGVNLPKNFLLAYIDEAGIAEPQTGAEHVLFYINPYNNGMVLGRPEIELYLKQVKISAEESYFRPCSNVTVVQRLLLNLAMAFEKQGNTSKTKHIEELMKLLG